MKERPILFSGPMVSAILSDQKSLTRRIVKHPERLEGLMLDGEAGEWCPYGNVGDRLWVRETWGTIQQYDPLPPTGVPIGSPVGFKATADIAGWCQTGCNGAAGKWRPSIFMPRWASRITLEITEVRVERLQEISYPDIRAEGIVVSLRDGAEVTFAEDLVNAWQQGWDKLNAKRGFGWQVNPWVWVIEFKRLAQG
jgi:hypothetical protein